MERIPSEGYKIDEGKIYSANPQDFDLSEFDSVVFCFHAPSTETHIIDPFLAQVLEICSESPLDINQLSSKTSRLLDTEMGPAWIQTNLNAVNKLVAIKVIHCQPG